MAKGDVVAETKLRWGCKKVVIPLYVVAGAIQGTVVVALLGVVDMPLPLTELSRLGTFVLVVGLGLSINDKINRKSEELSHKIDCSVGAVWDAGQESGRRHEKLESQAQLLPASVRRLVPRR